MQGGSRGSSAINKKKKASKMEASIKSREKVAEREKVV